MLSKRLHDALNAQVNAEFWSAYLYLAMSVDASLKGDKGIAHWFMVQFKEEQAHAQIFMNYLISRGCKVELAPIAEVKTSWANPMEAFKDTLEHEKKVTALIHNLYDIAVEDKDYASQSMLKWFIDEQVEEEESAQDIIDQLEKVDDSKLGLYMIDKDLSTRVYNTPAPLVGKE